MSAKGIPFDSPLFEADLERGIEYRNCEALAGFFTIRGDVEALLPEGLKPYSRPAQGGVWIAHYSFSTLGEYYEYLTAIQVEDEEGGVGYYIPYIYVTNDAALAAGRELVGAPKKLAKIALIKEYDLVMGYLERPAGKRLVTFVMKPTSRALGGIMDAIFAKPTYLYSVRHLPAFNGGRGITQLVKWHAEVDYHQDPRGERVVFTGPGNITYDSPSAVDPVHRVEVDSGLLSVYMEFDMELGVDRVLREYEQAPSLR